MDNKCPNCMIDINHLVEQRCLEARIDTAKHITCLSGEGYFYWQYVGTEGEQEFIPLREWTSELQTQLTNLQNKDTKRCPQEKK